MDTKTMIDSSCQTTYTFVWKKFADKLKRTYSRKRKAQIYDVQPDIFSGDLPEVTVTISYDHPVLDYASEYWCGAGPEEDVYENPYAAENHQWEVSSQTWNKFQNMCKTLTQKELQSLKDDREKRIRKEIKEYDSKPYKRRRYDDEY